MSSDAELGEAVFSRASRRTPLSLIVLIPGETHAQCQAYAEASDLEGDESWVVVSSEEAKSEGTASRPTSMTAGGSEGGNGGDRKSCSLVTQMADPGEDALSCAQETILSGEK